MAAAMLVAGAGPLTAGSSSQTAVGTAGLTTLKRSIVGKSERELAYGPGETRYVRDLRWGHTGGRGRPLAAFKHISDVHVVDEESPARVEFLDQCESPFSAAYRVQEAMSTQVGNSMLEQLAKIKTGPVTGARMSFLVSTGDNIDNKQLNEERLFIDLLDGEMVNPNSGGPTYDGYTKEQFAEALETSILEKAQEPFDSVGVGGPWYAVLGNHDGLVQGNAPSNEVFNSIAVGGTKPFRSLSANEDCPDNPDDGQQMLDALVAAIGTDGRPVPADPQRQFLSHTQLVEEYFNTTGVPDGHGLANAPDDPVHPGDRAGYYSFRVSKRIRGISLDTIGYNGAPDGNLDDHQFTWLEEQLKKNSRVYLEGGAKVRNEKATNKLIVIFSHHSSLTLNNPGGDPAGEPYHCFEQTDNPECAGAEGLHDLLLRFPNVIAWVNGHEHNNRVRRLPPPEGEDPALGLWEINTAAHIDWPQQSRLIEIAWKPGKTRKDPDTIFIYGTIVDHGAAPDPDEATQSLPDYLASISRVEAFYDACTRIGQADCAAGGRPKKDRNVKLVQKAPFNLGR
ncbi:MAG: hypothetical protein QOH26_1114 [Actinomycetota bacterium]|nr:hypothetical protein [Actinomycetota bacterium]